MSPARHAGASGPASRQLPVGSLVRLHLQHVNLEWQVRLLDAWAAATPAARVRGLDRLLRGRRPERPIFDVPTIAVMMESVRILRSGGADIGEPTDIERLVGGLDLRCKPGAFRARREGRPTPITVPARKARRVPEPSTRISLISHLFGFWMGSSSSHRL